MPKKQEAALKRVAAKLAKQGKLHRKPGQSMQEAKNAMVYGTMRHQGWHPSGEKMPMSEHRGIKMM